jgi:hypothetical protein
MKICLKIPLATLAMAIAASLATAQATEQLDAVNVGLMRDPSIIPFGGINRVLTGLQRHGEGLFRTDFKLRPKGAGKSFPFAPKLALQSTERYLPIAVASDGAFELPVLPAAEAKEADLASNQAKGTLAVEMRLHLTTPASALDMATVRRIMRVAQTLRSELLPWYLRWLFPQIEGVRICSAEAQWQLAWPEQGQLVAIPLTADPKDRDPDTLKGQTSKPCTSLSGQERWPDEARLIAPADAELSVRLASRQAAH